MENNRGKCQENVQRMQLFCFRAAVLFQEHWNIRYTNLYVTLVSSVKTMQFNSSTWEFLKSLRFRCVSLFCMWSLLTFLNGKWSITRVDIQMMRSFVHRQLKWRRCHLAFGHSGIIKVFNHVIYFVPSIFVYRWVCIKSDNHKNQWTFKSLQRI